MRSGVELTFEVCGQTAGDGQQGNRVQQNLHEFETQPPRRHVVAAGHVSDYLSRYTHTHDQWRRRACGTRESLRHRITFTGKNSGMIDNVVIAVNVLAIEPQYHGYRTLSQ